ncbi:MAG: hypothetical protein K2G89_09930 [Lachnospiraceae bacterium]|nr:hypothetical protein [Lachnospiraceae bacterium]
MMHKRKIATIVLCVILLLNVIPVYAIEQDERLGIISDSRQRAVVWLAATETADGMWGDTTLCNDTCSVYAVLQYEKNQAESAYFEQQGIENKNVDELAHFTWATGDELFLEAMLQQQNPDGGFGFTNAYTSDVYDTALALMAIASVQPVHNDADAGTIYADNVMQMVSYLASKQCADGGFSYNDNMESDGALSADIGIALLALGIDNELYTKLDTFCLAAYTGDFSETFFASQARLARYLYMRGIIPDAALAEEAVAAVQGKDGSIYADIEDTMQFILLQEAITDYHTLKLQEVSLYIEADSYVLEASKEQTVNLETTISYQTNQQVEGTLYYTLLEDGESILAWESPALLIPEQESTPLVSSFAVTAGEDSTYELHARLVLSGDEEAIAEKTVEFSVHVTQSEDLVLQGTVDMGEDYGVHLSWNDISDGDNRYGYRVFRKKGDSEWETRSTWDGSEKVKVLNVYPPSANYLKLWMNTTINTSEEIASRGVLEIDEVSFPLYNKTPDDYLKDKNGNYRYDVIMIGSSDCNGGWDLSDTAYQATLAFTETGRGILFGHDSVVDNPSHVHRNLAKFGEQLGITYYKSASGACGNKVEVINNGFLTSYPWKLTGTMNIPYAHSSAQFIDTTLTNPATKWMRFQGYDADDDAYLFTRNQYAMIQTGHSNGQATDDERKIMANTLFYLKQFTDKTSATDKSFYDEAAPEVTGISEMTADSRVTIQATDKGTLYQYYVEAVNAGAGENNSSNIVEAEALSGICGFIIGTSDNEEMMEGLLTYDEEGNLTSEVLPADGGSLEYTIQGVEPGQSTYLHIYAVDYAGNVSEEAVYQITLAKAEKEYFKLPYALFAGEKEVQLYCSEANIASDIYGAETFRFQGSTIHMPGTVSTTGDLSIAGGILDIAEKLEGVETQQLPDYMPIILSDMEAEGDPLEVLNAYNSTDIITPTICKTTTGAWCNNVTLAASLVSGDTVSFNANTITCGEDTPVVLGSENGDIRIQATKFGGSGLIYAPNGTVTINVSEFNYTGSIVAKRIVIQAGYYNQNQ